MTMVGRVLAMLFQFTPLREGRHQDTQTPTGWIIISIHAPPRGATKFGRCYDERILFQFTPLREGRLHHTKKFSVHLLFQFTPLREGRPVSCEARFNGALFQFTPLREGRRRFSPLSRRTSNFNSRPSARGDAIRIADALGVEISIHAPPRGATVCKSQRRERKSISIHAPPRGATIRHSGRLPADAYFNSRPSARGDCELSQHLTYDFISIHAPPRGATRRVARSRRPRCISIHAPPRGATLCS